MQVPLSTLLAAALLLALVPGAWAQQIVASAYSSGGHSHHGFSRGRAPSFHAPYRRAPSRVWVPSRYETVFERVWVPAHSQRVWVEPVYGLGHDGCGVGARVVVRGGYWRTIDHPGAFTHRPVRALRPGFWSTQGIPY